jgi:hypothetical protein
MQPHVRRVILVSILVFAGAFIAQRLLQPKSFGERGHYRADSLVEIMLQEPIHQGSDACAECHPTVYEAHEKDVHRTVECEVCHGPGDKHVTYHGNRSGAADIMPEEATLPREYTLEGCLFCHRELAARPAAFAQIDHVEHYEFLHITDLVVPCIECHSPHEPLFLPESVTEARVHPVIFECDDCHETAPETSHKEVPEHPTIFVCGDCHPSVVRDFRKHEHAFLRCTACHLYRRENENSGRVFRTGNREFCLLCHEQRPFRDPELVPQVVSDDHIAEMAPIMRRSAAVLRDDPAACLQCHFDFIHDSELIKRLQEQER